VATITILEIVGLGRMEIRNFNRHEDSNKATKLEMPFSPRVKNVTSYISNQALLPIEPCHLYSVTCTLLQSHLTSPKQRCLNSLGVSDREGCVYLLCIYMSYASNRVVLSFPGGSSTAMSMSARWKSPLDLSSPAFMVLTRYMGLRSSMLYSFFY
jgi:hypothetical protein